MLLTVLVLGLVGRSLQAGILPHSFVPVQVNSPARGAQTDDRPSFCHDLECPKYSVLQTNNEFETRHYESSMWVATMTTTMLYTDQQRQAMFFKLFHYISGNNTAHMKIDMTTPVVEEILHGQGPDCESNFTMHFMMPFQLQADPPMPTEDGIFIRRVPEKTVYVKQYGGYSTDDAKRVNTEQLVNDLNTANMPYENFAFYTAGYDGPYSIDRHNEIWVLAKQQM